MCIYFNKSRIFIRYTCTRKTKSNRTTSVHRRITREKKLIKVTCKSKEISTLDNILRNIGYC